MALILAAPAPAPAPVLEPLPLFPTITAIFLDSGVLTVCNDDVEVNAIVDAVDTVVDVYVAVEIDGCDFRLFGPVVVVFPPAAVDL